MSLFNMSSIIRSDIVYYSPTYPQKKRIVQIPIASLQWKHTLKTVRIKENYSEGNNSTRCIYVD